MNAPTRLHTPQTRNHASRKRAQTSGQGHAVPANLLKNDKRKFLTMQEDIALGLSFECVGESRYNRTMTEYAVIAQKLPRIKVLHDRINARLKKLHETGSAPLGLCYFQAGDRRAWIKPYPKSLSIEVVRSALVKSGMRKKQIRKPRKR